MTLQEISQVFSVFHDGTPQDWHFKNGNLELRISCLYLAELISPSFEFFNLTVHAIENFEYKPWEPFDDNHLNLTLEEKLNHCDFTISSSKTHGDRVEIYCGEDASYFNTTGGTFPLKASAVSISAEDGRQITLEELLQLSDRYLDNCGK